MIYLKKSPEEAFRALTSGSNASYLPFRWVSARLRNGSDPPLVDLRHLLGVTAEASAHWLPVQLKPSEQFKRVFKASGHMTQVSEKASWHAGQRILGNRAQKNDQDYELHLYSVSVSSEMLPSETAPSTSQCWTACRASER